MSNWEVSSPCWPALQTVGAGWQAGPFSILLSEIMFSMVNRSCSKCRGKSKCKFVVKGQREDFAALGDPAAGLESLGRPPCFSEPGSHLQES